MTNRQISCQRATWGGGGDVSLGSLPQGAHGETEAGSGISRARFGGKCWERGGGGFRERPLSSPFPRHPPWTREAPFSGFLPSVQM